MSDTAAPDPAGVVRYAVVGLGWISQAAMLPAFANARRNSRLTALVSGDRAKRRALARRYELPDDAAYDYDAYDACLDRDDVDAVYLGVPNHLHREYAVRAAERGVHVLCEKPMAVTKADCRAMIEACRAAGVRLMVAYRLHLDPATLHAVARIKQGAIGDTRIFSSTFCQQVKPGDVRLMPVAEGGGPLYDMGVYCINAARYLFRAEPDAVWAVASTRSQERFGDADEMMSCVLQFPGERVATFTCSFGAHAVSWLQLVGDGGEIRMDNAYEFRGERTFELRAAGGDGGVDDGVERRRFPEHDQFGPQLLYFSDCILHGRDPEPDGEEGLVDVRIVEALLESAASGREVEIEARRDRRPEPEQALERPALEAPELVNEDDPSA